MGWWLIPSLNSLQRASQSFGEDNNIRNKNNKNNGEGTQQWSFECCLACEDYKLWGMNQESSGAGDYDKFLESWHLNHALYCKIVAAMVNKLSVSSYILLYLRHIIIYCSSMHNI